MSHSHTNKLIAATALSLMAASPLAAEADTATLGPAGEVAGGSPTEGREAKRTGSKAERQYRVLYRRAERADGRPPGRNIVEDGVRDGRRARAATRKEIERSITELRASFGGGSKRSAARVSGAQAPAATGGSSSSASTPASAGLESIAACESGGNPGAVGGGGQYRGKYQFDQGTWASVGGSGDPAAASESEQDSRAAALVAQQGTSPWPNCGG